MFSEAEITYLNSQYLARLGTLSGKSQPTVDTVGLATLRRRKSFGQKNKTVVIDIL